MRLISHYPRTNYWSSSKISHKIREHFGLENPFALTWDEWDEHHEACHEKAPFVHWLTDRGFNKIQNIVMFPKDAWWSFKTATIWKYFRNLWLFHECLLNYRSWDYSGMLLFMETCARDMAHCQQHHGNHVGHEKTAKELQVFAELLRRVRLDEYSDNKQEFVSGGRGIFGGSFKRIPNTLPNVEAKSFYTLQGKQRVNDLKLAAHIFQRRCLSWWS